MSANSPSDPNNIVPIKSVETAPLPNELILDTTSIEYHDGQAWLVSYDENGDVISSTPIIAT